MKVIETHHLTKSFWGHKALCDVSFSIEENKITGLIGRNGAGKSTLLKMIAGTIRPTSGHLEVFSEVPFNNLWVSAHSIFIDDKLQYPMTFNLGEILLTAGRFYKNWDQSLAEHLLEYFHLPEHQYFNYLSKGMQSTFNTIVGICAKCPLTLLDEPTTGMDAAVRKDFYRALLKDYLAWPRTIIISSHHLNEVQDLLEDVLLLKKGSTFLHLPIDELKTYAKGVTGRTEKLNEWIKGHEVLHQRELGVGESFVVVKNDLSERNLDAARAAGFQLATITAEDVCVYLTNDSKGGIDDVFGKR